MPTKPIRRIVTGHDAAGRAVVTADSVLDGVPIPNGQAVFTLVWTTATAPVDNDDVTDGRDRRTGLTLPGGSVLRVVDLLPGSGHGPGGWSDLAWIEVYGKSVKRDAAATSASK